MNTNYMFIIKWDYVTINNDNVQCVHKNVQYVHTLGVHTFM